MNAEAGYTHAIFRLLLIFVEKSLFLLVELFSFSFACLYNLCILHFALNFVLFIL